MNACIQPHATPTKRLHILQESLRKKEAVFDACLRHHMETVAQANGQPLNDKRNGAQMMRLWDRQNETLRTQAAGIEKTRACLEIEQSKINHVAQVNQDIPQPILDLLAAGTLQQWRKYPNRFFVNGVEKGRIIWDMKKKQLMYSFYGQIQEGEQRARFRETYNTLRATLMDGKRPGAHLRRHSVTHLTTGTFGANWPPSRPYAPIVVWLQTTLAGIAR